MNYRILNEKLMQSASSIERLTDKLANFGLSETRNVVMEELTNQIKLLQDQLAVMKTQLAVLDQTTKVETFEEVRVNVADVKDISLDMFKTLPEFSGERNKYSAWRNSAMNVMKIFNGHTDKPKYFEALNIVRNKIVGAASDALTNYNTVFNFDAIIARLDFTYADKRPVYIIEQELIVLQQKNLSIEDFYDEVNKKLNVLINKINMTHKEKRIAQAMIKDASDKALRTFVTGLNGNFGRILYASNPTTLPEAYAKLQTIVNDQERIKFAQQFNQSGKSESGRLNPNFKPKSDRITQQPQNMVKPQPKPEPMDVDRSSMHVNIGKPDKRPRSGEFSNQVGRDKKFQRMYNIEGLTDEEEVNANELEIGEFTAMQPSEAEIIEETASVFLDK